MTAGLRIDYGSVVERAIAGIVDEIHRHGGVAGRYPSRWLAIELLEDGDDLRARLTTVPGGEAVVAVADRERARLAADFGDRAVLAVAGRRYDWINHVVGETVVRDGGDRSRRSDRLDRVLTHHVFGIPIFLAAMWIVFKLTADVSGVMVDWVDAVVTGPVSRWAGSLVTAVGLGDTWVRSMLVDGVVAGVGGILVFLPVLAILYLCLAVLEESGYMARAAVVMDRALRFLGLPGTSFLPMMVGFGCTVPAVYATRTLRRRRDRILTGLLVPFMSCAARLPVYVLFAAVFFPRRGGTVVFSMYLLGIVVALGLGLVLSRTVFGGGAAAPLVVELPAYRIPSWRDATSSIRLRTGAFIRDAGTIILGTSMVLWLLLAIPVGTGSFAAVPVADSAFGRTADAIAPGLAPAGFGTWEAAGSLVAGFVAKEVVVTSLAQVYGTAGGADSGGAPSVMEDLASIGSGFLRAAGDTVLALPAVVGIDVRGGDTAPAPTGLMTAVRDSFEEASGGHGTAAGLAFMVFVLLYTPCVAAVAAQRHELGKRWMWASVIGQTGLAWVMAVATFQTLRLTGLG